jgi:DNA-directed RNA polymerase subunit RPC12/RpoP
MINECEMTIIETPEFKIVWECSHCEGLFADTDKFVKNKKCPNCNSKITVWNDFENEDSSKLSIPPPLQN